MKWTRRHFLQLTGGIAATVGLGLTPKLVRTLSGKAYFEDWRALPGMNLILTLEVESPETTQVELIARTDNRETHLMEMAGSAQISVQIPYFKTGKDSYELIARVVDDQGRYLDSEPVEVITESFHFGM